MKLLSLVIAGVLLAALPAQAHPDVILVCEKNLKVSHVSQVGETMQYENGLIGERYDRNGDGKIDIEALSIPHAGEDKANIAAKVEHRRFPLFYVVDVDLDGNPDAVYIDRTPDGVRDPKQHCANVVLYEDLSKGRGKEDPTPDHLKKNDL
jgi:hypothetical protein